jgi:hypothetical protein
MTVAAEWQQRGKSARFYSDARFDRSKSGKRRHRAVANHDHNIGEPARIRIGEIEGSGYNSRPSPRSTMDSARAS